MPRDIVLVLNAGSSSLKFSVYASMAGTPQRLQHGEMDGLNATPSFRAIGLAGRQVASRSWPGGQLSHAGALVFTAGIGEHAAPVRERICRDAAWLGVELDAAANGTHGPRISSAGSRVSVWVIPTDEELMIARHSLDVLAKTSFSPMHRPKS